MEAALVSSLEKERSGSDTSAEVANDERTLGKPWYRDVATIISVAAFLFSFGTTIVSYKRTSDQDVHNLRAELRGLLQRLAALPKENYEIVQKYVANPTVANTLSGYVNEENLLLSKQADEVLKRLPKAEVSATDYIAVASALTQSRNFDAAVLDFNKALIVATILDDETGALRQLASLEMMFGKTGDARSHFQQALDIFGKPEYRGYDAVTKAFTNLFTELAWATAEANSRNWDLARDHIKKAEQLVEMLPNGTQKDFYKSQVLQSRSDLEKMAQAPSPSASVPPAAIAPGVFGTVPAPGGASVH